MHRSNPFRIELLLTRLAPAKINLGLHVLRRRADGFHDIETVFLRIPWADELTACPSASIQMTCSDPALPTDEGNLCVRAARRLAELLGTPAGAEIHLEKHVPYGAGLGGGSSDAAATLQVLLDLWGASLDAGTRQALAAELGSDVPFFLGPAAAHATGRGEVLTPLVDPETGNPYTFPFSLVVAVPPVEVSTAQAYRLVRPRDENRPDLRAAVCSNDLDRWRAEVVNDFEAPVFAAFPAVRQAREMLVEAGAGYTSLSGSGSAVFGVFEDVAGATAAAEAARQNGLRVWHGGVPNL